MIGSLAEEISGWINKDGQKIEVFEYVEDCVKNADLIVTATFASNPVLKSGLKNQNCHIMAVGAPRPEWSEIDPDIWNTSQVYVDSFSGALAESGDLIESKAPIKVKNNFLQYQKKKYYYNLYVCRKHALKKYDQCALITSCF